MRAGTTAFARGPTRQGQPQPPGALLRCFNRFRPGAADCDRDLHPIECIALRVVRYRFRGGTLNQDFADAVPLHCDHGVCSPFVGHRLAWFG